MKYILPALLFLMAGSALIYLAFYICGWLLYGLLRLITAIAELLAISHDTFCVICIILVVVLAIILL
ncbi:MAG: hypothetical protein IJ272_03445 [Clostridia bacterium]|nr:hypothetical protein [Clostridia bacterium]